MAKKLIIAEKPSVAADIARAMGGFTRKGEYFESDKYVLSSAVGHLLELTLPPEHDVKKGKWSFARLPVIPPHFDLKPVERSKSRLNAVVKQADQSVCFLYQEGKAVRLPIQPGRTDGTWTEVFRKQKAGIPGSWEDWTGREEVLTGPAATLSDGQAVSIR